MTDPAEASEPPRRQVTHGTIHHSPPYDPQCFPLRSSKLTATAPLDLSQSMSARVQDLVSLIGARKKLPTNVPSTPIGKVHYNVNALRFRREQSSTRPTAHRDGGREFSPNVCVDNWVEDRRDPYFLSGTHPKELLRGRCYQTVYNDAFRPQSAPYVESIKLRYSTAKFPSRTLGARRVQSGSAAMKQGTHRGAHISYVRDGFGAGPHQDHTTEERRGAFWVGTAAPKPYESVAMTASQAEPLEFQGRCRSQDPTSMLLLKTRPLPYTDASTRQSTEQLLHTQRWTRNWETTCHADFVRHSLR